MSDQPAPETSQAPAEEAAVEGTGSLEPQAEGADGQEPQSGQEPQPLDPQRLLRIAGVVREVLEEARRIRPEPAAVDHLRRVHAQINNELKEALPTALFEELDDLTPEIRDGSLEELALAHAEILGWLEGLFQGTQLALQMQAAHAAQAAMLQQRGRPSLPRPSDREPPDTRYL
jgi:acetoin utilization deacetylase AcuC-like enzyme